MPDSPGEKILAWRTKTLTSVGEVRQLIVRLKEVGYSSELVQQLETHSTLIEKSYLALCQIAKAKEITVEMADDVIGTAA